MTTTDAGVLIVGAGPAGAACATTLREEGFTGPIVLAGREPDPPYHRPPVSKEYLEGRRTREECLLHPEGFWAEQGIDLRTRTSVMRLDPAERTAKLSTGEEIGFGAALVATGANVRRLRVEGAGLEGIHYLRALANADAIRADAAAAERVVLIGGSYVACEVAASLTAMGKACTLVMAEALPLSSGFGPRVGAHVAGLLRSRGIELVAGDPLASFVGEERVRGILTQSGRRIDADLVVMGTGAVPDVMLARAAGLALSEAGGVACDAALRTSAPGVWAAGDVAEYDSVVHGRRLRVEHWEVARAQGAHAARGMLGAEAPFSEVPYFWSDLADWATVEAVGPAASWDGEIVRGSVEEGAFSVFYLDGPRLAAAMTIGRPGDLDVARELMLSRADARSVLESP